MVTASGQRLDVGDSLKAKMPTDIKPMLAMLVAEPFDRRGWFFEIKWDGYRAIAEVGQQRVRLYSRTHVSFADHYPSLIQALQKLSHEAVLDGEIVVLDDKGRPQFQLLQKYRQTGKGRLVYCIFDLLFLDGHDLRNMPLRQRKELLQVLLGKSPVLLFSEHIEDRGIAFFQEVSARGLEGMVAKNGTSSYREGTRSHQWLKVKTRARQEMVIGGFTQGRGGRQHFGALVLGVYEGNELVYVGHVGSGFTEESLAEVRARLEPLVQSNCPFRMRPKTNAPVQWVRPELVCEVEFREWSGRGHLRQPIFRGLRADKSPCSVHREVPRALGHVLRSR
jgi:bifunctional non-homologous end joining protein LigD